MRRFQRLLWVLLTQPQHTGNHDDGAGPWKSFYDPSYCMHFSRKVERGAVHLSLGKTTRRCSAAFPVYRIQRALKCLPGESKSTRAEADKAWAADLAMFGEEEKGQQRRGARSRVWTAVPLSAVLNAKPMPIPRFTYLEEDRPPSSTDTGTTRKAAGAHLFLFLPPSGPRNVA